MKPARLKRLKNLLWLYFWLLIFEGALRRWVLPGLNNPLLLVRDPIALLAVIWAWPLLRQRRWSQWLQPLYLIAPLAFLLAITVGHGDIITALFGCRILLLHLPLIFVFAAVFNREDVFRFAWVMLWLSIPMTMLIAAQSSLPATHILNVAAGGEGTSVFAGAADRFRPAGTFSFTSGVTQFFVLGTAALFVVLYGAPIRQRGRLFCALAGIALVVAIPVSISRGLLAGNLTVTAALIVALLLSRSRVLPVLSGLLALVLAAWIATSLPAFQQTAVAFTIRWESAAAAEAENTDSNLSRGWGVFETRIIGSFTYPLARLDEMPFFGYGIGAGTNVGSQRLTGERAFVLGEFAWEIILAELGPPLGLGYLLWRLLLSVWLLRLALGASVKGNRLPLILLGVCFLHVLNGPVGQPTTLGFLVVSTGLTLAACNEVSPDMVRLQPQRSALPT